MSNFSLKEMDSLSFKLEIEKVAGLSDEVSVCRVFSKRITFGEDDFATVVACILVKDGQNEDIGVLVGDIFEISTKKLEDTSLGILDGLRLALSSCRDYVAGRKVKVSFAEAVFYKGACYIARYGDDTRVFIFERTGSHEIKFECGSGMIRPGQVYLLGTDSLFSLFDSTVLSRDGQIKLEEVIDGLATEISAKDNQSVIGGAFVYVKEAEEEKHEDLDERTGEDKGDVTEEEILEEKAVSVNEESVKPFQNFKSKFKNSAGAFLGAIVMELKKLKRGDIAAVVRMRRNIVAFALIIVLILVISAGLTVRQRAERQKLTQFNTYFSQASSKYGEAMAIVQLNKSRARGMLIEADKDVGLALSLFPEDEKAKKLSFDIGDKLKETEVTSNVNFIAWELPSALVGLSFAGKDLIGFSDGKIFEVNVSGEKVREFKGVEGAKSGFVFDNRAFILTEDKIFKVDLGQEKSGQIIERADAFDIVVFLGNVYLQLDDGIAKYVPIEGGYLGPEDYLNNPWTFSKRSRLAIDGSIWVTSGDAILKFTRGAKQDFEISGLAGKVGEFGAIYTNSQLKSLYVVDSLNSALLVIDKDGTYRRSYQSPEFARAADLVIDDTEENMYLSVGSKIFSSELE